MTPGRYEKEELTLDGIEDVRWFGKQIIKNGFKPGMVFFTEEKYCRDSALILIGVVKSLKCFASLGRSFEIPYDELVADLHSSDTGAKPIWTRRRTKSQNKKRDAFWGSFREALRTEETARAYFGEINSIPDDIEEIVVASVPGFGGAFPRRNGKTGIGYLDSTCWTKPVIWTFDIQSQTLVLSSETAKRFGVV